MSDKAIRNLTIVLISFVGLVFVYFLVFTAIDGYWIWSEESIDFTVSGQFGDFIGGFLGTIINGAAFFFLYLTLNEQRKSTLKQSFETKIYDLIHIHRENISELHYTKYYMTKLETSHSRKVFRVIVKEFLDCYHEVIRFAKMYPDVEVMIPDYNSKLSAIRISNDCSPSVINLAYIDIAFCFFYFGVSKESETILLHKFYNRYNHQFTHRLKTFLQLKPKEENKKPYMLWKDFVGMNVKNMKEIFEEVYQNARNPRNIKPESSLSVVSNLNVEKYYGGHQHRLGHYFRHLFQTFKYLSMQNYLSSDEKYFYGKSVRAQLSTYEQFILFFNSLSSLGMKWEYTADISDLPKGILMDDFKFISRYNLIKNLPGSQYYGFKYRKYYPKVNYEYKDDISYNKST